MKKVKWIALALVLCLGLIGGAYAAWDDFVTLSGIAHTGDMDVVWGDDTSTEDGEYNTMNSSLNYNNKILTVTVDDLYPQKDYSDDGVDGDDEYATLNAVFRNDGTVPVVLTGFNVKRIDGDWGVYNNLKVNVKDDTWDNYTDYLKDISLMSPEKGEVIEPGENSIGTGLEDYLTWKLWLCDSVDNDTQNISNVKFEIEFTFEQANTYDFE